MRDEDARLTRLHPIHILNGIFLNRLPPAIGAGLVPPPTGDYPSGVMNMYFYNGEKYPTAIELMYCSGYILRRLKRMISRHILQPT